MAGFIVTLALASCGTDQQAADDEAPTSETAEPAAPLDRPGTTGGEPASSETEAMAADTADTGVTTAGTADGETSDATSGDDANDEEVSAEDGAGADADDVESVWLATAKRGDSGDDVAALQERLNALGMGAGPADGDYGRRTEQAIRAFQRLVRLTPTGEADRITLNHLADFRYDGPIMTADSDSATVLAVQQRLADGPFDPGTPDGEYGPATSQAVWALEKLAGIPVDGEWGPLDEWAWQQLEENGIGRPAESNDMRWVEVDLSEQLVKVYDPGDPTPVLVTHASSGSGIPWSNEEHSGSSVTPTGDFHIQRRIDGWRESSLDIGRLYNPLYFVGGIALHGSLSVPLYPASHGCIRLPMHVAEYLPDELPNGTPVHVMA
jgi:peptidoglycan hydrolase-like protein with peptidoglycan-binding domain